MDLTHQVNNIHSRDRGNILREIFADSPLLQGLRQQPSTSTSTPAADNSNVEYRFSPYPPLSNASTCAQQKYRQQADSEPPLKRLRVEPAPPTKASVLHTKSLSPPPLPLATEIRTSVEEEGQSRFVRIAAAVVPRKTEAPEEDSRRAPVPRAKTGCYTCRKRRIKVRLLLLRS